MERIAHPSDGAQYGFYYSPIAGFDAYGAGKAKTIAGIKTPNASTIVFDLTRPIGDFLYRAGDSISGGLGWTRPIRFGGVQGIPSLASRLATSLNRSSRVS